MATRTIQGQMKPISRKGRDSLLGFKSPKSPRSACIPGRDFVDRIYASTRTQSSRDWEICSACLVSAPAVQVSSRSWPVSPGIEHSGRQRSFAKNPDYFDGGNIVQAGHRRGVQRRGFHLRVLAPSQRKYATKSLSFVKINHNELLTFPNKADQIHFGTVAAGLRHGRAFSRRRPPSISAPTRAAAKSEISQALRQSPRTMHGHGSLVAYLRNNAFKKDKTIRLGRSTGQPTISATNHRTDIIKQNSRK